MSPDQDINNSQASTAQWASLHHRRITAPWSSDSWSKMALANIYPCFSSSSFGHSRQTSVEREREGIIVVWSKWKLWISLLRSGHEAIFGTQSCPGLGELQPSNGPLCTAWPRLISHFYLNCNVSLPAHVAWCIPMYQNQFKVSAVAVFVTCDWIFGDIEALYVIVMEWIENKQVCAEQFSVAVLLHLDKCCMINIDPMYIVIWLQFFLLFSMHLAQVSITSNIELWNQLKLCLWWKIWWPLIKNGIIPDNSQTELWYKT